MDLEAGPGEQGNQNVLILHLIKRNGRILNDRSQTSQESSKGDAMLTLKV